MPVTMSSASSRPSSCRPESGTATNDSSHTPHRRGKRTVKNGNPHLSWAFSEAAHFANQHRPAAKRFFQRKKAESNATLANRALAAKLARASFYVMRDKVDPAYLKMP